MAWISRDRRAWDEVDYWALDLETSGLNPRRDAIESVGMIPIRRGRILWGERWYRTVRPRAGKVSPSAIAVHRLLPAERAESPDVTALLPEIAAMLEGSVLLLHYSRLDLAFLRRAFRAAGHRWHRPPVIDTSRLLGRLEHRQYLLDTGSRPLPRNLTEAGEALGLPPHRAHHALHDALATAELFLMLRARLGVRRLRQLL